MALRNPLQPWKNKITRIDRLRVIDCVPDAFAIVSGIAVGAFHLFWAIMGPECIDSAWDRVGPRGRKHRSIKAMGFAVGPQIGFKSTAGNVAMFAIGNAAQKIGFGMALIDGTLNGIYYGTSLMYRYTGCVNPNERFAQQTMTNQLVELFPAGIGPLGQWNLVARNGMSTSPNAIQFLQGTKGEYSVYYALKQAFNTVPGVADCTFTSYAKDTITGERFYNNWSRIFSQSGDQQIGYTEDIGAFPGVHNIEIWVDKTDGILAVESAMFVVQAGRYHAPMSAYECGVKIGALP